VPKSLAGVAPRQLHDAGTLAFPTSAAFDAFPLQRAPGLSDGRALLPTSPRFGSYHAPGSKTIDGINPCGPISRPRRVTDRQTGPEKRGRRHPSPLRSPSMVPSGNGYPRPGWSPFRRRGAGRRSQGEETRTALPPSRICQRTTRLRARLGEVALVGPRRPHRPRPGTVLLQHASRRKSPRAKKKKHLGARKRLRNACRWRRKSPHRHQPERDPMSELHESAATTSVTGITKEPGGNDVACFFPRSVGSLASVVLTPRPAFSSRSPRPSKGYLKTFATR